MNHAFIFQVHTCPELLNKIINLLIAPNHYFFIHVDKKVDINPFKDSFLKNNHVIFLDGDERIIVNHGGFSQIQCTLNLLRKVSDFYVDFDYIHSLSGQDFPLVNVSDFEKYFEQNNGQSYMMYDSEEEHQIWSQPRNKYEERYRRFYFNDREINFFIKKLLNGIQRFFYLRSYIPQIRGGWSWFSWHISVVNYILKVSRENPRYFERFKYTSCCDEIVFHTLLYPHIKELNIITNNCLRYIDWHPKRKFRGRLPLTLNEKDFNLIAESKCLFCRKVELNESKNLLKKIEETLINHL